MVLLERGYTVSGSDRQFSPLAQRLQEAGAHVFLGHQAENVAGADLVVRSSAVPDENVEVQAALAAGVPVLKRSGFLGQLMVDQQCIAVAGTHGKTTTTAMIAWMLTELGLDPSYIIGGIALNLGRNAHAGQGPHFVIEADEYDQMFLGLRPQVSVVTNVEHDHPDCYPTYQDFYGAFQDFAGQILPGGTLIFCGDDVGATRLAEQAKKRAVRALSFCLAEREADYYAGNMVQNDLGGLSFLLLRREGAAAGQVALRVPGEHNVRNALAALAVADVLGLPLQDAARALGAFRGAGRRFEIRGDAGGVVVIDDYAHHPSEIRATLSAARSRFPGRSVWAVWQPHTYSRIRALFADFAAAFGAADHVLVTEIYAARESAPQDGFSARRIVEAIAAGMAGLGKAADVHYVPGLAEAADFLIERVRPSDVVIVLSAGDADQISARLLQTLEIGKRTSVVNEP
jgi:UDP-N-acetylmuramate--alanine ligase